MSRAQKYPLVLEWVNDPRNMGFLTIIEYKGQSFLTLVDNAVGGDVYAYVLDFAASTAVDMDRFFDLAVNWFYGESDHMPFSFFLAGDPMMYDVAPMKRSFRVDYITRMIGRLQTYDLGRKPTVRRKKVQRIPSGIEVTLKRRHQMASDLDLPKEWLRPRR